MLSIIKSLQDQSEVGMIILILHMRKLCSKITVKKKLSWDSSLSEAYSKPWA